MEAYDIEWLDPLHGLGLVWNCQSFLSLTICVMFLSLSVFKVVFVELKVLFLV